jgi:hypothetical protein
MLVTLSIFSEKANLLIIEAKVKVNSLNNHPLKKVKKESPGKNQSPVFSSCFRGEQKINSWNKSFEFPPHISETINWPFGMLS